MANLSTVLSSILKQVNVGEAISASDTVKSLLNSISSATSADKETFNDLLSSVTSKIQSGRYSTTQIGDATKNLINSLHSELSSGNYSADKIGEATKKIFSSNSRISETISSMSSTDLGNAVKTYVSKARDTITSLPSSEIGENIRNNISTYTSKIKNNTYTIDDINKIVTGKITSNTNSSNTSTNTNTNSSTKTTTTNNTSTTTTTTSNTSTKDTTDTSSTKTTTTGGSTSISETIYYDHDQARSASTTIQECYEALNRDNVELKTVLADLSSFWRGSLATRFTNQLEEYIDLISKYYDCLQDGYDNLKNGSKAYSTFDEYFASKTI